MLPLLLLAAADEKNLSANLDGPPHCKAHRVTCIVRGECEVCLRPFSLLSARRLAVGRGKRGQGEGRGVRAVAVVRDSPLIAPRRSPPPHPHPRGPEGLSVSGTSGIPQTTRQNLPAGEPASQNRVQPQGCHRGAAAAIPALLARGLPLLFSIFIASCRHSPRPLPPSPPATPGRWPLPSPLAPHASIISSPSASSREGPSGVVSAFSGGDTISPRPTGRHPLIFPTSPPPQTPHHHQQDDRQEIRRRPRPQEAVRPVLHEPWGSGQGRSEFQFVPRSPSPLPTLHSSPRLTPLPLILPTEQDPHLSVQHRVRRKHAQPVRARRVQGQGARTRRRRAPPTPRTPIMIALITFTSPSPSPSPPFISRPPLPQIGDRMCSKCE